MGLCSKLFGKRVGPSVRGEEEGRGKGGRGERRRETREKGAKRSREERGERRARGKK